MVHAVGIGTDEDGLREESEVYKWIRKTHSE